MVRFLVVLLAVFLAAFAGVMFSTCIQGLVGGFLGLPEKNEILKFLGIGMGGVLLAIQAVMSYMRAKAMEGAAKAQAGATKQQAKANENAEKGLRQERLKNAIEHLGHESDSVRLGGAYELFHLAQDTESLRQTALDILCAHIRRTTGEAEYRAKQKSKPSEEIQSLLTLLFVQEHEIFKGLHINLQGSCLNGANLEKARLRGAILDKTYLQRADLCEAQLQGASLWRAQLQGVRLTVARLQEAVLLNAHLWGADLKGAQLHRANLGGARLQGVDLSWARLYGATLFANVINGQPENGTQFQGAILTEARLHGADLHKALLQGVVSSGPKPSGGFAERMMGSISRDTDLSGVIFSGGLSQEDVDSLVEGLYDEGAKRLREKLTPHIDKPESHELPKYSGAITGAYTAAEAEEWIASMKGRCRWPTKAPLKNHALLQKHRHRDSRRLVAPPRRRSDVDWASSSKKRKRALYPGF